uniref:ATP-binding protein n=1 Tax=Sphaerisporangium sp. CA-236357 TaxID=3240030 RepID=UPI003F49B02F
MTATAPATATGTFPGLPCSIAQARAFAAAFLPEGWCSRAGDLALVVSELATNAVLHSASGAGGGTFALRVEVEPGAVTVTVADQGPALVPAMRTESEHGRGLVLVAELADAYKVTITNTGRTAWCRLDLPEATR